jgi:hypothetical protein
MNETLQMLVVAWTLYLEAADQGEYGMYLGASVIANRGGLSGRNGMQVCLTPRAFSCWNTKQDPVAWIERQTTPQDEAWRICWKLANQISCHRFSPVTQATHYHRADVTPLWTKGMTPCTRWRSHVFWRAKAQGQAGSVPHRGTKGRGK